MTKKFETREEAAIYMIQNPGVELVSKSGIRYRWHMGSIDLLNLTGWWPSTMMDEPPYTLPEPKKEELPFSKGFAATLKKECCATCTDNFFRALYRQFREWSKDEDEARARAVAIEEIERAWVWEDDSKPKATAFFLKMPPEGSKLKRGES